MIDEKDVASLLIPTLSRPILLPNVTVAEIVPYQEPAPNAETPDWHLGDIVWRETSIPLLSIETLNGIESTERESGARIAIMNTVSDQAKRAFYAVVVQGIPRLIRVFAEEIAAEDEPSEAMDAMYVQVNGERAVIPDLDAIEQQAGTLS